MMTMDSINVPAVQERATKIMTDPKMEWQKIEPEPTTIEQLYKGYVIPLAAIPAVASFIGQSLIGLPILGRIGIVPGIIGAALALVMSLIGVYVSGMIVSRLAPSFESRVDDRQALKLVAYAYTPAWVAGVLNILPFLGLLSVLGALYSIYLFYLGVPVMMKTPEPKVIPYMAVSAIVIIVLTMILYFVTAAIMGTIFLASAF